MAEEEKAAKENDATESDGENTGLIARIKSDKKLMMMVGGGALLFLLLVGGAAYFFLSGDNAQVDNKVEEGIDSITEEGLGVDESASESLELNFERVHMYPLNSFFFPIKLNNKESSGHFLLATPSFSMSNGALGSQISKNLPSIRKRVYNILLNETYINLTTKTKSTKARVKKRIMAKVNEVLPVGTGVVKEVFFSEFIVK
jgi:flagellar basal body-associated protein FliL